MGISCSLCPAHRLQAGRWGSLVSIESSPGWAAYYTPAIRSGPAVRVRRYGRGMTSLASWRPLRATADCESVPRNELARPHVSPPLGAAWPRTPASCRCRAGTSSLALPCVRARRALTAAWAIATPVHWVNVCAACPRSRPRHRSFLGAVYIGRTNRPCQLQWRWRKGGVGSSSPQSDRTDIHYFGPT